MTIYVNSQQLVRNVKRDIYEGCRLFLDHHDHRPGTKWSQQIMTLEAWTWLNPSTTPPPKQVDASILHTFFQISRQVSEVHHIREGCTGQSQHLREKMCVQLSFRMKLPRLGFLDKCRNAFASRFPMSWLTIRGKPEPGNNEDLLHLWMTVVKDIALMMDKVAWMQTGWKAPHNSSLDVSWRWQRWLVYTDADDFLFLLCWHVLQLRRTSCFSLTQRPSDLFLSLHRVHSSTTIL